jgi:hypothetical protein
MNWKSYIRRKHDMNFENVPDLLPNKPSELIEQSLLSLDKLSIKEEYKYDSLTWHNPNNQGKLTGFDLSGCLIADKYNIPNNIWFGPHLFPNPIQKKMIALDYLRKGKINEAAIELGLQIQLKNISMSRYVENPFRRDLLLLNQKLREQNL